MNFPDVNIRDIRAKNRLAQVQASIVSHIEERLAAMESYTREERKERRRRWAAEIVAAALSIRDGAQS